MGMTRGAFYDAAAVSEAVAKSSTQIEAIRLLGFKAGADNYRRLREACVRYSIPMDHLMRHAAKPGKQKYSRKSRIRDNPALTERAVREASTMRQACLLLGIAPAGKNYDAIEHWCAENGLTPPQRRGNGPRLESQRSIREALSDQSIQEAVEASRLLGQALHLLGLQTYQENAKWLSSRCEALGLRCPPQTPPRKSRAGRWIIPFEEYFVQGVKRNQADLRRRAIQDGLIDPTQCALCDQPPEWNGKPLRLQLDHVNGDSTDNRPGNLWLLCPNCHSQTETFCRNKASLERRG